MINLASYVATEAARDTVRASYVVNPTPAFAPPERHKRRPLFIQSADQLLRRRSVACWAGWRAIRQGCGRSRHFNVHRARAMQAVAEAALHYLNRVTWQIETSIDTLARQCGLDSHSAAGNHSISRASRVIQLWEEAGLATAVKYWDPVVGCWAYKAVTVTALWWDMIGIGAERAIRERELAFERWRAHESGHTDGLSAEEVGRLSLTAYAVLRRERLAQKAFEHRRNKKATVAQIRRAKRLVSLGQDEMRRQLTDEQFKRMTPEQARRVMQDLPAFNASITLEMSRLRARATDPLPG